MLTKPTFVICPGAWPVREFFVPVQSAIESHGYPTAIHITDYSNIESSSPVNPDTASLRKELQTQVEVQNKEIVLLMHSYGGAYGPSSILGFSLRERKTKGLKGGIVALIFFSAFVTRKGESALSAQGMSLEDGVLPDWAHYDPETGLVELTKARERLFHDFSDEEAKRLVDSLPKMPIASFTSQAEYDPFEDEWYKGLFGYVFCGSDKMLPIEAQRVYAERAGVAVRVEKPGFSHTAHLEEPEELVECVLNVLKELVADEDLRK